MSSSNAQKKFIFYLLVVFAFEIVEVSLTLITDCKLCHVKLSFVLLLFLLSPWTSLFCCSHTLLWNQRKSSIIIFAPHTNGSHGYSLPNPASHSKCSVQLPCCECLCIGRHGVIVHTDRLLVLLIKYGQSNVQFNSGLVLVLKTVH